MSDAGYAYRAWSVNPGQRWPSGNWCFRCEAFEDEPPKARCTNPKWHLPTSRETESAREVEFLARFEARHVGTGD